MLGSRAYLAWEVSHPILLTGFLWNKPHSHVQAWCRSQASWIWQDVPTLCREESINMTAPLCFSFTFSSTYVVNVQKSILQTTSDGVPRSSSLWYQKEPKTWRSVGSSLLLSAELCSFSQGLFLCHSALFVLPSARESKGDLWLRLYYVCMSRWKTRTTVCHLVRAY